MTESALRVEDLSVRYGASIRALEGVWLDVPAGGAVALLGANGAGKTSLLRAVTGLLPHHKGAITGGRISVNGQQLSRPRPGVVVRAGLAQAMEGRRLFRKLSVQENIAAGAATLPRRERKAAIQEAVERFPAVAGRLDTPAGLLSGGQQQLVAIARALASRPTLLILDEPTLGLAPVAVNEVRDVLLGLRKTGLSLLLVEQNAAVALSITDHAYVLQHGRVATSGSSADLASSESVAALYLASDELVPAHGPGRARHLEGEALPWMQ